MAKQKKSIFQISLFPQEAPTEHISLGEESNEAEAKETKTPLSTEKETPTLKQEKHRGVNTGEKVEVAPLAERLKQSREKLVKYIEDSKLLAQACYSSPDWDEYQKYGHYLREMQNGYSLLVLISREEVEDLRVACIRAVREQAEVINNLHEKMAVTRGDRLVGETVLAEEKRLRLEGQLGALNKALAFLEDYPPKN